MSYDNFTFAAIDIDITDSDRLLMLDEVRSLDNEDHFYNEFRGCRMIPIFNSSGKLGRTQNGINGSTFKYTPAGQKCPTIRHICETKIFPWMDPPGRVTILRTSPGTGLNVHIDCKENEIGSLQHKYRLVLNGSIDHLYFIDRNGNKVYVPNHYNSYVIDGSHAHSIDAGEEEKITLCIGAPWKGSSNNIYKNMINKSDYILKVSRSSIQQQWVDPAFAK